MCPPPFAPMYRPGMTSAGIGKLHREQDHVAERCILPSVGQMDCHRMVVTSRYADGADGYGSIWPLPGRIIIVVVTAIRLFRDVLSFCFGSFVFFCSFFWFFFLLQFSVSIHPPSVRPAVGRSVLIPLFLQSSVALMAINWLADGVYGISQMNQKRKKSKEGKKE